MRRVQVDAISKQLKIKVEIPPEVLRGARFARYGKHWVLEQ